MRAAVDDPIIRKAQERLRVAAEAIERGRDELRAVLRSLERHPDYIKTEQAHRGRRGKRHNDELFGPHLTLAWWLHNGTHSTLFEMDLDGAPGLLLADADPNRLARSMRESIEQEAREEKRRAA